MKILVGISKDLMSDNTPPYEMHIVDVDYIDENRISNVEWEKLDIEKLAECSNVEVDIDSFKSDTQWPGEYLKAEFDLSDIIGYSKDKDFLITDIYYDENNHPQLYRTVNSSGYIAMHDISEFQYRKSNSVLGKDLEQLPKFVRKSSLEDAYEWWRKRDEAAKNSKSEFLSSAFEAHEDTPVKLFYHYLTGVKGFKEGYHTVTEMEENHSSEVLHEYMLFKDTANIKLSESISKDNDRHSLYTYGGYFDRDKDPYPNNRKLRHYGAEMSMICSIENFPEFDLYNDPIFSRGSYDEKGVAITLSYQNGLISAYNKIESAGCIQENWRLGQYGGIFGMTVHALLPEELSLLGARLQSEKEGVVYGHVATHGHFSTFNTDSWIRSVALVLSTKYYSEDLKNKITPILDSYLSYYNHGLDQLIDSLGSTDAYYTMQWTKDNSKEVLKRISKVMSDGSLEKSDIGFVDEIKELFTFARNDYDLPDWLRIYEPEVIKGLGGVDLLKDLVATRGEEESRKVISSLAPGIEHELKEERRQPQRKEELQEMLDEKNQIRENNFTAIESKK